MIYSNWPNFIVWLSFLFEIFGNMCIAIVCFPGCNVISFEINLIFLIQLFFYITKNSKQKGKYLEKKKELLKWNKKHFSSVLKGFQWSKVYRDIYFNATKFSTDIHQHEGFWKINRPMVNRNDMSWQIFMPSCYPYFLKNS